MFELSNIQTQQGLRHSERLRKEVTMTYEWDIQTGVSPKNLKDVLNEFDGAGYDIYNVLQERFTDPLTYIVIARSPKFPPLFEMDK